MARKLISWEGLRADLRTIRSGLTWLIRNSYWRIFSKKKLSKVKGEHLSFNFGSGSFANPGWTNVDSMASKGVFWADFREPLSLPDACAEHIHCEHLLEHLEYSCAVCFLGECHRILEPNGSLRVILPDAGKYLEKYSLNDREFFEKLDRLGGAVEPLNTRIKVINQVFRMGGAHLFGWDFETLESVLREIGFSKVERSSYGEISENYNIDGSDDWRQLESLYVNAWK